MRVCLFALVVMVIFAQDDGKQPESPSPEERLLDKVPQGWRKAVKKAFESAGENKKELLKALSEAKNPLEFEVVAFSVAQSAYRYTGYPGSADYDCKRLTAEALLKNARLAIQAWRKWPWAKKVDKDKFLRFIAPYRSEFEKLQEFREPIQKIESLAEKVADYAKRYEKASEEEKPKIFRELIWFINTGWLSKNVKHARRGTPFLSPVEVLRKGRGGLVELGNTLVALLRTYGIAATTATCLWWPKQDGDYFWVLVWSPDENRWLSIDNACGGRFDSPNYFKRFVMDSKRPVAKVYVCVPGEERGENVKRCGDDVGALPPKMVWLLLGRPAVDWTDRFTRTVTLTYKALERGKRYYLCVLNGGRWRPVDAARANDEGVARFTKVGAQVELLYAVCKYEYLRTRQGLRLANIPVGPPFILKPDGSRKEIALPGKYKGKRTEMEMPNLPAKREFSLYVWTERGWRKVQKDRTDERGVAHLKSLVPGALYILVYKSLKGQPRALRPFVVE